MAFSAGKVLARSVTIFGRNIVSFTILAAIIHSPLIAYAAVVGGDGLAPSSLATFFVVERAGRFILGAVMSGAVSFGVLHHLRGGRASSIANVARGLARVDRLVGASLLIGILVVLACVPGAVVIVLSIAIGRPTLVPALAVVTVVLAALVVASIFWVAAPAVAVEGIAVWAAPARSARLTKGRRAGVLAIAFVVAAVVSAASWGAGQDVVQRAMSLRSSLVLYEGVAAFIGGFAAVTSAVCYHDLRVDKEGVGTEDVARTFD
jgi:hypothetical protein